MTDATVFFIVFVMFSSSRSAGIGTVYNCKIIGGVFRKYNKEMTSLFLSNVNFTEESFEAYDEFHKHSFNNRFLILSRQGANRKLGINQRHKRQECKPRRRFHDEQEHVDISSIASHPFHRNNLEKWVRSS